MKIKLNLGCGKDIRLGYINIDAVPANENVIKGDASDLDSIQNSKGDKIADDSAEEIVAIHLIEYLPVGSLQNIIKNWAKKLCTGGTIWLQAFDYDLLCNNVVYDRIDIININKIIFGDGAMLQRGLYNLINVATTLETCGFEIIEKGYQNSEFYVSARKK